MSTTPPLKFYCLESLQSPIPSPTFKGDSKAIVSTWVGACATNELNDIVEGLSNLAVSQSKQFEQLSAEIAEMMMIGDITEVLVFYENIKIITLRRRRTCKSYVISKVMAETTTHKPSVGAVDYKRGPRRVTNFIAHAFSEFGLFKHGCIGGVRLECKAY